MELLEKSTDLRKQTDKLFALDNEVVKYRSFTDEMNKFVTENQLKDAELFKNIINQFRSNVDDDDKGWRCEYFGKIMRGGALTYAYTKDKSLYRVLEEAVKDMLTTQDNLGRFSTYSVEAEFDGWDLWGRKYVMLGLIYFYDVCNKKTLKEKIIKALKKHADYIVKHVGPGKNQKEITVCTNHWDGLNSCSILEPFMRLYYLTNEKRYLDFAAYIVKTGFTAHQNLIDLAIKKSPYPYQYSVDKAYEMMSCFQGLFEYAKTVKNDEYIKAVINFVDMVKETEITVIGGGGTKFEQFDNSVKNETKKTDYPGLETCVTATWMNFCYQLLLYTGESKYADYIEEAALNGMFGAVNTEKNKKVFSYNWQTKECTALPYDGIFIPFDSYSPLIMKRRAIETGGVRVMANNTFYGCCAAIGALGTSLAALYGVLKSADGYVINLYDKGTLKLTAPSGQEFSIKIDGDAFTGSGKIKLIFAIEKGEKLKFKLRIPEWSKKTDVTFNGQSYAGVEAGSYFDVDEFVENKDVLEIHLDNRCRAIQKDGKVALKKGAVVLARDERYLDGFEKTPEIKIEPNGTVKLKAVKTGKFKAQGEFLVPLKKGGTITVCDYASAGKDWDNNDKNRVTVWM